MSLREQYIAAADQLVRESGVTVHYHKGPGGVAYTRSDDWLIVVPMPTTARRFATFAHEVAHQLLHRNNSTPRWLEEWEAWDYALKQFARFDLPGVDAALRDAASCLRYAAAKAERRSRRADIRARIEAAYPRWVWFA